MESTLKHLEPERLWFQFSEICKVPRPSKKEEKIAAYLRLFAGKNNLECIEDDSGNVLIRKKASPDTRNIQGLYSSLIWIWFVKKLRYGP